jgi:hypothetical protein
MSKVMGAVTVGGRHRLRLVGVLAAIVVAAALVPWVSTETAQPHGSGHDQRGDKLLFFASDGLRQDAVERYADQ